MIGSVAASLYASRLTALLPPGLPPAAVTAARGSVGGAAVAAGHLRQAGLAIPAHALDQAALTAFLHSLTGACLVAAGVAAGGVLLVAFLLPSRPRVQQTQPRPAPGSQPQLPEDQAGVQHADARAAVPGAAAKQGDQADQAGHAPEKIHSAAVFEAGIRRSFKLPGQRYATAAAHHPGAPGAVP